MPDLHAPTLRRVIEMLDGEIAEHARAQRIDSTADALRAFRERLERELTTTEAPE